MTKDRSPTGRISLTHPVAEFMDDPNHDTADHVPLRDFADLFFVPSRDPLQITFGSASHTGRVRAQNEDHFVVLQRRRTMEVLHSNLTPDALQHAELSSYTMVVADGMGGMKSGEVASRLALQTMVELSGQATSWVMDLVDLDAQQIRQRVQAYVRRMHSTLQELGRSHPNLENMGTTWTSAHILARTAVLVHIGDSRAYLFSQAALHQITRDETMAQALVETGMEPDSVRKFRHILLNSLGGGNDQAQNSIHLVELEPNDQLLLCTDGLTDMVDHDGIAAVLQGSSTPQAACDELIRQALENGGKDNVTVVIAQLAE